jgi:hypothetical protein
VLANIALGVLVGVAFVEAGAYTRNELEASE